MVLPGTLDPCTTPGFLQFQCFQFVFAATAATIVSGAIAERCQFFAYFAYSIILTGWVYPPVSHWAWDGSGWLAQTGFYYDFAGSGVVHLMGASCAIVGCYFMGPRRGRFNKKGEPIEMPGHSVPLAGLGGFILIFGFLAFNGGSQASISNEGDGDVVALAIVNTILGASTGGMTVLFINKFMLKQPWSFLMCLNGALAGNLLSSGIHENTICLFFPGMVALCGGCNYYEPWAALIVGGIGGIGFMLVHFGMLRLKLDDPLDAVAVHGAGGLVGILSVPWFMHAGLEEGQRGIFWDGGHFPEGEANVPWSVLGYNIAGSICIMLWSFLWSFILFGSLYWLKMLRVSTEDEFKGMDVIKHGESAYPAAVIKSILFALVFYVFAGLGRISICKRWQRQQKWRCACEYEFKWAWIVDDNGWNQRGQEWRVLQQSLRDGAHDRDAF